MQSIIIYGSQYGAAQSYAEALSQSVGIQAVSYRANETWANYEAVIYIGSLYGGKVKGLRQTAKHLAKDCRLWLATVGLADATITANQTAIKAALQKQLPPALYQQAAIFHLRGQLDYQRLQRRHKIMLTLWAHSIQKTPAEQRSPEDQAMLAALHTPVNLLDIAALQPLITALQGAL